MLKKIALGAVMLGFSSSLVMAQNCNLRLTEKDVTEFQNAWGKSIVAIGEEHLKGGDYRKFAKEVIDKLYAYDDGGVLFKPTKVKRDQFRETKEDALSYFVGGGNKEDSGFAIRPWSNVRFKNHNILIDSDSALVMGNYFFTDKKTNIEVKVEFTFGLKKAKDCRVVANLQHSSLPFASK